jgi:hypothetical protein
MFEEDYSFNPATKTIIITRNLQPQRLMLITNVTKNIVIYNFSDPNLGYTSWTREQNGADISTHIVLEYNTAAMSSTDKIQVIIDDYATVVDVEESLQDAVGKLRTSQPQSLMDTDFEYSLQPSKWESLFLTSNYPSFFPKGSGGNSFEVTSLSANGLGPRSTVTVTTAQPHGLVAGNIVSVQDAQSGLVEGTFLIASLVSGTQFTYVCKGVVGGELVNVGTTSVYGGDIFDNAHIPGGVNTSNSLGIPGGLNSLRPWNATSNGNSPSSQVTIVFETPHGLYPGTQIVVSNTNSFDGTYAITSTPTTRTAIIDLGRVQTSVVVPNTAVIIAKSDGYIIHRPADGGVQLTTYNNVPGSSTIRQTRRYFRYQSGKGIQYSTGSKFTPTFDIQQYVLNAGNVGTQFATITTQQDHCLQVGAKIFIEGMEVSRASSYNPFNGNFVVSQVVNSKTLRINLNITATVPSIDLTPAGLGFLTVYEWDGGVTRTGMFDDQNGFFFEFDGQGLSVCRRHSEKEIMGRVSVTTNSNIVTGIGTQFRKQLLVGESLVIRGGSYRIIAIGSDTQLFISPAYRGASAANVRALLTQTKRFRQSDWNIDKLDGTGPSGFELDTKKMQMVYIDYSWYGAGFIRYGVRGVAGDIVYFHQIANNNKNVAAYQRSGNLPARYEVANDPIKFSRAIAGASGTIGSSIEANHTSMWVEDAAYWPASGTILVQDVTNIELMTYSSIGSYDPVKQGYQLNGLQRRRSVTINFPDQNFTYSGTTLPVVFTPDSSINGSGGDAQVSVQPINQTCAPMLSHWGSSVIMDGRFDNDQNYIFTGGMTKYLSIPAGTTRPLLAIRLAPSVDNGLARNFGVRELTNRMQLQLASMGVQTNGSFRLDGILNPSFLSYTAHTTTAMAAARTATGVSGNPFIVITDVKGTNGIVPGMLVSGTNIGASGTNTVNYTAGDRVYLTTANSGTVNTTVTFTPRVAYTGLPNDWTKDLISGGSLAQVLYFDNTGPGAGDVPASGVPSGLSSGGDSVISVFTENGSASSYNVTAVDLRAIRELGNSILGGNGNPLTPSFPNGPDILVITATNIGAVASNISARISWTEAQA